MTQQDALRMALEALNSTGINRGMHGDNQYFDDDLVAKALAACQSALAEQPALATCKSCNGNDGDAPCAYPSEGKHGCLRDARLSLAEQDDEAVAYGIPHDENNNTFAYELLAMELAAEEHDDIHQLVYEGYPPEPWGEVWQRYEADAKKMIERVQKHTRPAPKTYTEHDIDVAIGVVEWDKLNLFATAEAVKQIVMRFAGSHVTMEPKRLSEEEVAEIMDNNGAGWWTKHNLEFDYHGFANALMDKMTGGGK